MQSDLQLIIRIYLQSALGDKDGIVPVRYSLGLQSSC